MIPDLSSHAADLLSGWLPIALKGALLLAIALAVVTLMTRAAASTRHAVVAAALAGLLLLPVAAMLSPSLHVPVVPPRSTASMQTDVVPSTSEVGALPSEATGLNPATSGAVVPEVRPVVPVAESSPSEAGRWLESISPEIAALPGVQATLGFLGDVSGRVLSWVQGNLAQWQVWLVLAWLGGVFLVASRWVASYMSARRIVDEAQHIHDGGWLRLMDQSADRLGVRRHVRLLVSDRLAVPVVWGVRHPAIILPGDCSDWDDARREVVLMHEYAHIARYDALTQMVGQAAVALHWFNPLAWTAYRRSLAEREQACDDLVLINGTRASDYAGHIVQIARRYRQESLALSAVAAMARSSELNGRVEAILATDRPRRRLSRSHVLLMGCAAVALTLPLAAFSPFADERAPTVTVVEVEGDQMDDWRWEGRLADGGRVEVYGLNGSVRVREGRGNTVRVQGTPRGRNADRARLVVYERRGVLAICIVHEGQRGCEPGSGTSGSARGTRNATINLEVTVPQRAPVKLRTTNGSIQTDELSAAVEARTTNGSVNVGSRTGDVRVQTTNGAVRLTAAGRVEARTTNGSIEARLHTTGWAGTSRLNTTNGAVRVFLPAQSNVSIDARSTSGGIRSSFDEVEVQRRRGPGGTASGTIGRGGRQLEIRTTNGSITISRSSDTSDASFIQPARDGELEGLMAATVEDVMREIEEIDWEAIREQTRRAQEEARLEMERARAELAQVDWAAIEAETRAEMERARAELEQVDWAAIEEETRSAMEVARQELAAIDWDSIRRESQLAQEEAMRELERARSELDAVVWPEIREQLESILDEVRRGLAPSTEEG